MAARKKKAKRKAKKKGVSRKGPKRAKRKSAASRESPGELVVRVAQQMAAVIERGLERTLAKLPRRGTTAAAKAKLKDAIAALRRQADAFREQAHALEVRGALGPAGIWRPLGERIERAATELKRRLGR